MLWGVAVSLAVVAAFSDVPTHPALAQGSATQELCETARDDFAVMPEQTAYWQVHLFKAQVAVGSVRTGVVGKDGSC